MITVRSIDEVVMRYSPDGLRIIIGGFEGLMGWQRGDVELAISLYRDFERLCDHGAIERKAIRFDVSQERIRMARDVACEFVGMLEFFLAVRYELTGDYEEMSRRGLLRIPVYSPMCVIDTAYNLMCERGQCPEGYLGGHKHQYGWTEVETTGGSTGMLPKDVEVLDLSRAPEECLLCGAKTEVDCSTPFDPKEVSGSIRCPTCGFSYYFQIHPEAVQ